MNAKFKVGDRVRSKFPKLNLGVGTVIAITYDRRAVCNIQVDWEGPASTTLWRGGLPGRPLSGWHASNNLVKVFNGLEVMLGIMDP